MKKCKQATYSKNVSLIVYESSMFTNPRIKIAHSVTSVTTIKVNPSAEKLYRLRKVIKNPNPPINIIWMSIITVSKIMSQNRIYSIIIQKPKYPSRLQLHSIYLLFLYIHGYFSKFSLNSSSCFSPCI